MLMATGLIWGVSSVRALPNLATVHVLILFVFLMHISGLNLVPDTISPQIPWYSSVPPGNCRDN
jgi:hypothetical protein